MMRTGYILHSRQGEIVRAIVDHCDGRKRTLQQDAEGRWSPGSGDLHAALRITAADLDAAYGALPAPILDRSVWLSVVVLDRRTTAQSMRIAALIAMVRPGVWLGVHAIADELEISFKNVPRTVRRLVRLGFLAKRRDGPRILYVATLPGGPQ